MPEYRLYWLDSIHHIERAENHRFNSDGEALEKARALVGSSYDIEVWTGSRVVGRVAAAVAM